MKGKFRIANNLKNHSDDYLTKSHKNRKKRKKFKSVEFEERGLQCGEFFKRANFLEKNRRKTGTFLAKKTGGKRAK